MSLQRWRAWSTRGAATPPDTDDEIFISPSTALSRNALTMLSESVPILTQQPAPQAARVTVDQAAHALAAVEPSEQLLRYTVTSGRSALSCWTCTASPIRRLSAPATMISA